MIQLDTLHPIIQEILFGNLTSSDPAQSWKAQIANLLAQKISPTEFKQYVVHQLTQMEEEIHKVIRYLTERESLAQQILADNLKTKALLNILLEHPKMLAAVRNSAEIPQNHGPATDPSLLVSAAKGEEA